MNDKKQTKIMSNEEITALAREYGEFTDMSPVDKKNISAICECFLKFVLRRHCLVEKSKLTKMYKEAVDGKCKLEKMQPQNTYAKNSILMKVGMNAGCAYTLKSLFPDLGKEVES